MGKSEFYKENLDFLYFNISSAGLQPNHKYTKAVHTYPAPRIKEDIIVLLASSTSFCKRHHTTTS